MYVNLLNFSKTEIFKKVTKAFARHTQFLAKDFQSGLLQVNNRNDFFSPQRARRGTEYFILLFLRVSLWLDFFHHRGYGGAQSYFPSTIITSSSVSP